jgi:hypothetical protein
MAVTIRFPLFSLAQIASSGDRVLFVLKLSIDHRSLHVFTVRGDVSKARLAHR